ncbi:MAG: choline/ethanolamine kinase family protein [Solirubrobacterales bacterium]
MFIQPDSLQSPWGPPGPEVVFAPDVPADDLSHISGLLRECDPEAFGAGAIEVACLVGGANNRNYTATGRARKVVVRIANNLSERFSVDRVSATQAQRDAAAAGIAPEVLAAKLPEGYTVSAFLEGETLRDATIRDDAVLGAIGKTFRRLHDTPTTCGESSPFEQIRMWTDWARRDKTELPPDLDRLVDTSNRIESLGEDLGLPAVFCHNDTVPQNFIRAPDGVVRLVDWDFAGTYWASFEIASFVAVAQLDERQRDLLLDAYAGGASAAQLATLELLGFVGAVRELSWAFMAAPILSGSTTLFDGWSYESHRDTYLAEARRRLATPGFEALFSIAASEEGRPW